MIVHEVGPQLRSKKAVNKVIKSNQQRMYANNISNSCHAVTRVQNVIVDNSRTELKKKITQFFLYAHAYLMTIFRFHAHKNLDFTVSLKPLRLINHE